MRKSIPRARLALPLALCVLGALLLEIGAVARRRGLPDEVELGGVRYHVIQRNETEHDLVANDRVALTLEGSADTLCEVPRVALIDVDGDGALDLYHEHCRGHGYVTARGGLHYVDLDRTRSIASAWTREVLDGGARLLVVGAAALLTGLALIAVLALHRRRATAVPAPMLSP